MHMSAHAVKHVYVHMQGYVFVKEDLFTNVFLLLPLSLHCTCLSDMYGGGREAINNMKGSLLVNGPLRKARVSCNEQFSCLLL